ncbi:MAG: hypothetical protein MJ182_02650 [Treponema sp.]|nr:hypothetical protein [Treponema sp.]
MTTEKVSDMEMIKLSDYFVPQTFRTVSTELLGQSGGITEVSVIFHIHGDFAKQLYFNYSGVLTLYGFGHLNDTLKAINQADYMHYGKPGLIDKVSMNDCGDVFIMVIELKNGEKILKKVPTSEVKLLLNSCRHPTPMEY